jgi:hypothetical protein
MDPLLQAHQQIGQLEGKVGAFHSRMDKLEMRVQSDLTEIKSDLKSLTEFMHRQKGWGAGALFVAGVFGSLLGTAIGFLVK